MNRRVLLTAKALAAVSLIFGMLMVRVGKAGEEESARHATEFRERVQPFLREHCADCHGADLQEGEVSLHALEFSALEEDDVALWTKVAQKLTFAEMPPAEAAQPSQAQRTTIANWISSRLSDAGREPEWRHKLLYPEDGNLLDHAALFDRSNAGPAYTPSRWANSFSPSGRSSDSRRTST